MDDRLNELPKGWVWTTVGDIGEVVTGTTPSKSKSEYYGNSFPFYKPTDLNEGYYVRKSGDGLSEKGIKQARLLPANSVVVTCIGATIGKTGLIRREGASNQQINAIITEKEILQEFIYFICISPQFQKSIFDNASATTLPILNKSKFEILSVPIPPLPEQHRIVSKIEELFTRLDAGVEALKKIKAQLKRYRQAVLKYAFEGKLTEKWREANKGKIEPAPILLQRIKEQPKKETKGKPKELPPLDTSDLSELPEGWGWINFAQLIPPQKNAIKRGPFGSAIKKAFFVEKGFKVYEQQNAIYDNPRLGNYYINQDKFDELIDFEVKPGDFIVSCSGTIGKIALIPKSAEKGIINQALLKLTIDPRLVSPKFFLELFRFDGFQKKILKETRGSAMKNINSVEDIKLLPVPLPPLYEQYKIVEEIESRLSIEDNMEKVAEQSLKLSDRLRQSILKRAFEGKLVPQDSTDEPAEKLLERIKEEKAKREAENKREKKHRTKNSKQMELI